VFSERRYVYPPLEGLWKARFAAVPRYLGFIASLLFGIK
jgi:hypothetical protein